MNKTVFDNVAFPLRISHFPKDQVEQQVLNILELVDLLDKRNAYPAQLSGGQKQRVGIARALANNPKIILSDEATSALDPTTTNSILELLKDINRRFNITVVVITHEMQVIKQICNKVAIMEDGAIVEEGSVIDIFTNPRSQTARNFTKGLNDIPEEYLDTGGDNSSEIIIRTLFIGGNSNQPVISTMIKRFDVDANILAGKIETIQDTNVGNLVLKITGNAENVAKAVDFLRDNQVGIEVLS
jgi:D-methionine transport system ATP-binding protein